jgi:hypothetical protein
MTESAKATRATVSIGAMAVDGFMLPDGSYRMSLSQAAEMVDLTARNAFDFLRSNAFKTLLGETYTVSISEDADLIEIEGQSRFRALPLEVVSAYWVWQSHRGNKKALMLVIALVTETLERRFDEVFEVTRTEQERNEMLNQRVRRLERDLQKLGEAYGMDDLARNERDYFERLLRENGIDPWGVRDNHSDPDAR